MSRRPWRMTKVQNHRLINQTETVKGHHATHLCRIGISFVHPTRRLLDVTDAHPKRDDASYSQC